MAAMSGRFSLLDIGDKTIEEALSEGEASKKEAKAKALKNPIVWMDLEMTGLDPDRDHILEVAVLITDGDLSSPHLEGPDLVIHQEEEVLGSMNEWSTEQHRKSGLTQRSRDSAVSLADAEDKVMQFLERHTEAASGPGPTDRKAQLAGNSVYVDRNFLRKHMPRIDRHLHWRLIDVSSILELARRWYPEEFKKAPRKKGHHTAMADIRESLNELKFYRTAIFKPPRKKKGSSVEIDSGRW